MFKGPSSTQENSEIHGKILLYAKDRQQRVLGLQLDLHSAQSLHLNICCPIAHVSWNIASVSVVAKHALHDLHWVNKAVC